ncbi:FAD-dependent oxidoreductase [Sphingomonas solaris]|uniref:FAD-dependent oxidoreductase n=1 Tax=Alterirhizorhabdus solaris TaxID=2529389 RepID=A0A558R1Y6_9SPHN|nr:FAD-dependent oxidoreductase [Sphingomonas solaris]TVV73338.1 FAD-dependent oxidoreductase [Sphingomonas solaris]
MTSTGAGTAGFDETYDFVVVGSGGGSMCAALAMRAAGKSVLIVEKTSLIGGTTARSGGVMWIPNNPFMKRDGVEDSLEKATAYLDSVVGDHNDTPGATRARRHAYLVEGPRMVDFLVAQGLKFTRVPYWPDYHDERPGGSEPGRTVVAELFDVNELGPWKTRLRPNFLTLFATLDEALKLPTFKRSWVGKRTMAKIGLRTAFAKLTGKHYVTAGAALQGRMLQAAVKAGVEFRNDAPVSQLVVENGAVTGVVSVKDGKGSRIGARLGVLVNAGGFAHNQSMRDQYQPGTSARWTNAAEGDTGEMILEMMRHGAAIAQMEEMVGNQMSIPPGHEDDPIKPVVQGMAAPHAIVVDQSGVRYMNESGSYMMFCRNMLERNREVPAVPSWEIFDTQYITSYMLAGSMPGANKPARWFDEGFLKKADTLEELAALIDCDPATLRATVERWNGFVAKNHDDDFERGERAYDRWLGDPTHRPNPSLGAIDKGPFYAMPVVPGDVGTYGGVVTDPQARVLREDGTPIPGLYATGVSTASVMGRSYPGAGASVGPSFVWGYIAAGHALKAA